MCCSSVFWHCLQLFPQGLFDKSLYWIELFSCVTILSPFFFNTVALTTRFEILYLIWVTSAPPRHPLLVVPSGGNRLFSTWPEYLMADQVAAMMADQPVWNWVTRLGKSIGENLYNRMLKEYLQKAISSSNWDWNIKLPLFLLAYRSAIHRSTGWCLSEWLYRKELHLPVICCLELFQTRGRTQ